MRHVVSSQQKAVLRVVRNLALFNGCLIVVMAAYAWLHLMPVMDIVSLFLTGVLASILDAAGNFHSRGGGRARPW